MPRETAREKGRRYVAEGRLTVLEANQDGYARAICKGDGAVYALGVEDGHWWCGCPARSRCAHLFALGMVVVVTRQDEGAL